MAFNFWEVNFRVVKFRVIKVTIAALFLTLFCTATFPSQVFAANDILLHSGGSVLTNPTPYLIFYGDWSDTASATAFTQMLSDYANSARFQMLNERYFGIKAGERYQIGKLNVSPANYTFLNYGEMDGLGESETLGTDLISASLGIDEIVAYAIKAKFKSFDPNGIYLVLTSADFKMFDWSGNEMSDCGWNSYNNSPEISPDKYNYIWAGEAGTELEQATCQFDPKISQNISAGYATVTNKATAASYKSNQSQTINLSYPNNVSNTFGSLENVAIHELEEAITDPWQSGWEVLPDQPAANGATQIDDLCAWRFSNLIMDQNQIVANQAWGKNRYLMQDSFELNKVPTAGETYSGQCVAL